jgi:SAM-dependent methyltransferase
MEESWFESFGDSMNVIFTSEDFDAYHEMVKEELPVYEKYLVKGDNILDLGCGLGCTSVPLSKEGYEVVGIDNDPRVIRAAKENGRNFGNKIRFRLMDVFDIDAEFRKGSFEACIHGGLLEHFPKNRIRALMNKQLLVAPLIICSVPVKTPATLAHYGIEEEENRETGKDGVKRNLWTKEEWMSDVLKGYNIVESGISRCHPIIGSFDELHLVIKK